MNGIKKQSNVKENPIYMVYANPIIMKMIVVEVYLDVFGQIINVLMLIIAFHYLQQLVKIYFQMVY